MKKTLIVIGVILIPILIFIFSYNGLVSSDESVKQSLGQIDTQLQRRNDLIPNLVETVKEYTSYEEQIFTDIAEARADLAGANTVAEQAEADEALNSSLSRLLAIAEAYPDLKANENFIQLQDELAGTENRIGNARRVYNEAAQELNRKVRRFPTVMIANMFGFEQVDYFEADEQARENPDAGDLFDN
ncbi:MAG: LemA family protein [Eubacteriales bacterium]